VLLVLTLMVRGFTDVPGQSQLAQPQTPVATQSQTPLAALADFTFVCSTQVQLTQSQTPVAAHPQLPLAWVTFAARGA
jgi:hypothetical protein